MAKTDIDPEFLKKLTDPKFYLENLCKIKTKRPGELKHFILNEAQKDLFNTLRKHHRIMILKARQIGFSTAVTGYFYWDTIMNPATTTVLIGYNSALTTELLDKVKTFYRTTPAAFRPAIHFNSKYEMSFPNVESKILVLPSTENVGRGYTISNCLVTELSSWEKAEEKMISIEAAVPIEGRIVIESTPKGMGNLFHRMWITENDYAKKEYGWWWEYSKEQVETIRRRINNPRKFAQEYELEFLASGRNVFDTRIVNEMYGIAVWEEGQEIILPDGSKRIIDNKDGLVIYHEPQADHSYIVGVDVAEGVEGGDYSVAVFLDRQTGEEAAFYRGVLPPDILAQRLDQWGRWYNNAFMAVEVNNHGLTTINVLKQRLYPSLYFRPTKLEGPGTEYTDKLGWKTTKITRPLLIDDLAQAVRDRDLTIHSRQILNEMITFVYDINSNMVPEEGCYDDCIFATGIAWQAFKITSSGPLKQIDYQRHLPINFAY